MVKLGQSGNYLKSESVNTGDIVTFKNEGSWETSTKYKYKNQDGSEGDFKKSFVISVEFKGEVVLMRVNKTSRDALIGAYGDDTADWVGKQAKALKEFSRQINADVIYLEPVCSKNEQAVAKKTTPEQEAQAIWDDA